MYVQTSRLTHVQRATTLTPQRLKHMHETTDAWEFFSVKDEKVRKTLGWEENAKNDLVPFCYKIANDIFHRVSSGERGAMPKNEWKSRHVFLNVPPPKGKLNIFGL